MKKLLFATLSLLFTFNLWASHVPGGDITYECLGNDQYLVTLTLYEDCTTSFESNGSKTITISNDCGITGLTSATLPNIVFQENVSQLCNSALSQGQSACDGGTYPGFYMHQYQAVVTLPGQCDDWTFAYSLCCRNTSDNTTGASSDNIYIETTVNNADAPCNSSPQVEMEYPITYVCLNQNVCLSLGISEPDGNILNFSFVDAMASATTFVDYAGGFSGTSPIPGITIDPSTGQINFVPTQVGTFLIAVLIEEYDANNNLIGTMVHELQVEVLNCNNQVFDCNSSGTITNIVGAVTQTGNTELEMCEGVSFSFDMTFEDPDIADSVFMTSNIASILPGAVVTFSYPNSPNANFALMHVEWTPPPGSANSNNFFSVTVADNSCPVPGSQTVVYNMNVLGSTNAGPDLTVCQGDEAQLVVANGNVFDWTVLSGDPIQVGTNFSCNPCDNPLASPSQTTTYIVESDLTGSCVNRDTVTVNVVPDFQYSLTQSSTSTCLNSEIQLDLVPAQAGNYSYTWSPGTFLNSTTIASPTVTPTTPGPLQYAVVVESQDGCIKYDTIDITVAAAYSPDVTMTAAPTSIMCGDTIHFTTDLGGGIPAVCGPSATNTCSAAATDITIGTGTTNISSTPTPFYGFWHDGRIQMIYLASELQAAGFVGGKITQAEFYITAVNSSLGYANLNVKMACTSLTELGSLSDFVPGLTQVHSNTLFNPTTGWNSFPLDVAYEWDGISNLIVEVCFDNTAYTSTDPVAQTATADQLTLYDYTDGAAGCSLNTPLSSNNRPNIRFTTCPTIPDPNNYTFDWSSNVGSVSFVNQGDPNPYSLPLETNDVTLVVTDNNGGCTDTVYAHIDVLCDTCQAPIPQITAVTCFGGADGEIVANPVGIDGPPFDVQLLDPVTLAVLQQDPAVTTNTVFTGLTAGDYLIRSYDTTGCWADTLVNVPEPPMMTLVTSADTIVCDGGTAILTGTAGGGNSSVYTYYWSGLAGNTSTQNVTPSVVTAYDVYALDNLGCSTDTLAITVNMYPPILSTVGDADTVCPGFDGVVSVTANGGFGGNYNYVWSDPNGNIVGNTNMTSVVPSESPTTYYVVITDGCETPAKLDSVNVYWYDVPQPLLSADVTEGCYPVEVTFTNDTDPTMVATCEWEFGDLTSSSTCGDQFHAYQSAGVYDVSLTITSPDGCVRDTTYEDMIEGFEYPEAAFGISPNPINVLEPVTTMYDSSSADVTSYDWLFETNGLPGVSNDQNPTVEFPDGEPNNFDVQLIVTNANGCTDTAYGEVIMNGVYNFYVPSAFSPNGDGLNDTFYPKGEGVDPLNYEMYIFDRWGNKVFETTESMKVWDGRVQGSGVKAGVYVWKIYTKDIYTDEKYENIGHVTVLR